MQQIFQPFMQPFLEIKRILIEKVVKEFINFSEVG
jgi:hypothetical protein